MKISKKCKIFVNFWVFKHFFQKNECKIKIPFKIHPDDDEEDSADGFVIQSVIQTFNYSNICNSFNYSNFQFFKHSVILIFSYIVGEIDR